jgi:MoaA/NifB/PqqE/SkfB family radical SAM enzyme
MIDVGFYLRMQNVKDGLGRGETFDFLPEFLEECRSPVPVVYNIETTNACNMRCSFCPRTTRMTRPVRTMSPEVFMKIALQLKPHAPEQWDNMGASIYEGWKGRGWVQYAREYYKIEPDEQSENAFFLYIIPRVIVLHGYGDPLLDPRISDYVGILSRAGLESYFSCNPTNINLGRTANVFESGLTYIKYSIDSLTSSARGKDAFRTDYPKIMQVLEMREKKNYKTQIVITMIDLGQDEFGALKEAFKGTDVYIYQKSADQAWLTGKDNSKSIHWTEPCQFPWSSMTINSSGLAVACPEDFNGEIVLGDAKVQSLEEIWNSEAYRQFRLSHFTRNSGKCWNECDMRVFGKF